MQSFELERGMTPTTAGEAFSRASASVAAAASGGSRKASTPGRITMIRPPASGHPIHTGKTQPFGLQRNEWVTIRMERGLKEMVSWKLTWSRKKNHFFNDSKTLLGFHYSGISEKKCFYQARGSFYQSGSLIHTKRKCYAQICVLTKRESETDLWSWLFPFGELLRPARFLGEKQSCFIMVLLFYIIDLLDKKWWTFLNWNLIELLVTTRNEGEG